MEAKIHNEIYDVTESAKEVSNSNDPIKGNFNKIKLKLVTRATILEVQTAYMEEEIASKKEEMKEVATEVKTADEKEFNEDISTLEFSFKEDNKTIRHLLPESYLIEIDRERFFSYKRKSLKRDYDANKITREQFDEEMDELFMFRRYPIPRARMLYQRSTSYDEKRLEFDALFNKFCVKTKLIDTYRLIKQEKAEKYRFTP